MATFRIYYNPKNAKKDGKMVVYIKVTHNGKQGYINTGIHQDVAKLERSGALSIKTQKAAMKFLTQVEDRYNEIAFIAAAMEAKDLIEEITPGRAKPRYHDFYEFVDKLISELKIQGRAGTAAAYTATLNSLKKWRDHLFFEEINYEMILDYERHFQQESAKKPTQNTIIYRMSVFRIFYNEFTKIHDLDIKNPWLRYRYGKKKDIAPRNLPVEVLRKIIDYDGPLEFPLSRDLFLISLFCCGINLKDLYTNARIVDGRLEYNRSKTARLRSDDAFSSILIQPEALPLIKKYTNAEGRFILSELYPNQATISNIVLPKGLTELKERLGLDCKLIYYSARHSVASIMSNEVGVSDGHVKLVLNHASSLGVTGKYIHRDFSKIDEANRKFLDYIFNKKKEG